MTEQASNDGSDAGNYLQIFIFRVPKKNHDAMVQHYLSGEASRLLNFIIAGTTN